MNNKKFTYYLGDKEVGSIETETNEPFDVFNFPSVEKIECVSILDLISKILDRMQEMQNEIYDLRNNIKVLEDKVYD